MFIVYIVLSFRLYCLLYCNGYFSYMHAWLCTDLYFCLTELVSLRVWASICGFLFYLIPTHIIRIRCYTCWTWYFIFETSLSKKKYLNENKTSKSFFGAMYLISVTMADCHTQPCKNASISDDNSVRFSFVSWYYNWFSER